MEVDRSITTTRGIFFHLDQNPVRIAIRPDKATYHGSVTIRSRAGGVRDWIVMGSRGSGGGEFHLAKRAMALPLQGHEDLLS
jgi:hypothetical protein